MLPPDGFRELRKSCLLSRKACADLLGCSLSAVRAWDRGTHRVPWSAVKLLRLFRCGDLGALRPEWHGWTINRNGLVSPEGIAYGRGDLGWWSLTCRQAEAFRQSHAAQRRATGRSVTEPPTMPDQSAQALGELPASVAPEAECLPAEPALLPVAVAAGARRSRAAAAATGLVSFQKQVRQTGQKASMNAGCSGGAP